MTHEGEPTDQSLPGPNDGVLEPAQGRSSDLELPQDAVVENLIRLLSHSTQALTHEEYMDSTRKRQDAVDKFLIRGGVESLRRFFNRVKQLEEQESIKLDLSMLEISDKLLGGLYLPGANLEKLIFSMSDISGSDIRAARLTGVVATGAVMRGIIATGSNWTDAVAPGADASGGRFVGCRFINTDMTDWIVDRDTNFAGAIFISTYIGNMDLSVPNTVGAVFRGLRR